jgi:aerobic-type carbon monoxide dehydrogenase small subunit (CoxS/CutS family)
MIVPYYLGDLDMLSLRVNGAAYRLDIDPETPLLWVLREQLGLTGTKYSCGIAECGACAVHVNGDVVHSCTITVGEVEDSEITTIEGFKGKVADALRRAWIQEDVPQCGYCQPGQIMTAAALLSEKPNPTDDDIDAAMSGVLCRCGTYPAIRRAIRRAAREI